MCRLSITDLEQKYKTMTSGQIAQELEVKPSKVRAVLSAFGVRSPRKDAIARRRHMVQLFLFKGWSTKAIAEQEEVSEHVIRMDILRAKLKRWVQLALWPPDWFRVEPTPIMLPPRIVPHSHVDCVQLSIPFPLDQQALAA